MSFPGRLGERGKEVRPVGLWGGVYVQGAQGVIGRAREEHGLGREEELEARTV